MKTLITLLALASVPAMVAVAPEAYAQAAAQLPNKGKVLTVLDTDMYTYIEVSGANNASVWLAAPRIKLAKGDTISYGSGPVMTNFHSKALNRDFASIVFVDKVVPSK